MNSFEKISSASISGMKAQTKRLQVTSENIANADTLGYRRKVVSFDTEYNRVDNLSRVEVSDVFLDQSPLERRYEPSNPFSDVEGFVELSNVNVLTEFADAREANRSYEAGLEVYKQARTMFASLLDLLRR